MSKITAERFKKALSNNSMKQIDLVEKTNFNRSAISQYVSGKVIPKDENLQILAKVLNVNEAWLLGYDIPMERDERYTVEKDSEFIDISEKRLLEDHELYNFITEDLGGMIPPSGTKYNSFSQFFNDEFVDIANKIAVIKNLVKAIKINKKTGKISIYMSFGLPPEEKDIIDDYNSLNEIGKMEAKKRIGELVRIDEYRKKKENSK